MAQQQRKAGSFALAPFSIPFLLSLLKPKFSYFLELISAAEQCPAPLRQAQGLQTDARSATSTAPTNEKRHLK